VQKRGYNQTALERIKSAQRHITAACRNLSYGVLQTDFEEEVRKLQSVYRKLFDAVAREQLTD